MENISTMTEREQRAAAMKTTIKKVVDIWFFLSFVAILSLDVDNSSIWAVFAVFVNFVAAAGVVIRNQNKERLFNSNFGRNTVGDLEAIKHYY